MGDKPEKEPGAWDACTWRGARLSFREKILWLEEGARLALAFKAAREQHKTKPPDPHP
jgi:hypothetical protein